MKTGIYQQERLNDKYLGKGSSGNVYKVIQNGIQYAVKKVPLSIVKHVSMEKFERQLKIMKNMDHRNIIKFHKYIKDKQCYSIYMELCDVSLKDLILGSSQIIPTKIKLQIMMQIIFGLSYLRSQRIAHRDLKPENIMLQKISPQRFIVKLIDFGQSRQIIRTRTTNFSGTHGYMAPEVRFNSRYNNLCDLWSIGIIFYQLFFHKSNQKQLIWPFDPQFNRNEVFRQISADQQAQMIIFDKKINVPKIIKKVIVQLLKFDPKQRLTLKQMCKMLNSEDVQSYFSSQQNEQIRIKLLQLDVEEKKLQKKLQDEKQNEKTLKLIFNKIFLPFKHKLTSTNQTKSQIIIKVRIFVYKIYQQEILKRILYLTHYHGWSKDDIETIIPSHQLEDSQDFISAIENSLIRKKRFQQIQYYPKQQIKPFIREFLYDRQNQILQLLNQIQDMKSHN